MKAEMSRRCLKCNAPLSFAPSETGKTVPLDLRAPVYEVTQDFDGKPVARLVQEGFYVSHFSTCPKANDFSSSKRTQR